MTEALTSDHLEFLRRHEIALTDVLDARGIPSRSDWQAELKRTGAAVALVSTPCGKGHALRLRLSSGHCMECSPQGIAHWKRRQEDAFLYIAVSIQLRLVKLGLAKAPRERVEGLNRDGYAGASDWFVIYRRKFKQAGRIEAQAHSTLSAYAAPREYIRKGHGITVRADEIFDCDYERVRDVLESFGECALGPAWPPCTK
jgi:hypothetical protein